MVGWRPVDGAYQAPARPRTEPAAGTRIPARRETHLHHQFADRKLNLVNARREFFRAKPAEVRDILIRLDASIVEWIDEPEALEWRQSQQARREHATPVVAPGSDGQAVMSGTEMSAAAR